MTKINRRTLMAAGTTFAAGGLFGSTAVAQEGDNGEEGEGNNEEGSTEGDTDFTRPDEVAWRYDGPHDMRSATVEGDRLYTQSDGAVYAIDTADGSLVWETGDIGATRTLVVEGGTVYVAGEPVQAIDAETGEINWESEFETFRMAVGHGMVYTSEGGTVYALNAEDGSVEWERNELTVEQQVAGETEEVTIDDLVMGDTDDQRVYVFGAESQREVVGLEPTTGETELVVSPIEGIAGVIAESGYIGVQPPHDSTYLYDVSTAEQVGGTYPSAGQTFSGNGYFDVTRRGTIQAYNLSAGGEMVREIEYAQSMPQVAGNTFVLLYGPRPVEHNPNEEDDEDRVVAYDLRTGEEQWRYVFDERKWTRDAMSTIAVDDNTVYLERDGELLALRSENEAPDKPEDDDPGDDEQDGSEDEDEQQNGEDDSDTGKDGSDNEDECCPDDNPADEGESGGDDNGGSVGDDDNGDAGNGNAGNGDTGDETDGENGNETDAGDDTDDMPGFTTGAGLLGGAATLEWLRRKAGVDESTSMNEPPQ